jgi:ketosteroid isomerase-like protein
MISRFVIVLMLLAGAAIPAGAQTKSSPPDAKAIAQGLAANVEAAIEKQDVAGWASYTTPDTTILPASSPFASGGIIHGRSDAQKLFAGMFQQGIKHADIKVLEAHFIGRSAIFSVGEIHFSGARAIDARFGQVIVQDKGVWHSRLIVLSGDPPPTGSGAGMQPAPGQHP